MMNFDWGEIIIFIIVSAIHVGVVWNKISDLVERVENLEDGHIHIRDNHQRMEVSIVNVPSKEDIKELSSKIGGLEKSLVRLEVTLDIMAKNQGINKSHLV